MPELEDLLGQVSVAKDEVLGLAQELVRIPSVNTGFMPTGDETAVAEFARDWLRREGIDGEILEAVPGRGSLVSRLDGSSGKAGLMYMSHLDVVPVEDESRWRFPPFSATVSDGRIYGRGAADCKSLLAAQMMAAVLLRRNDVQLADGLIIASGADEEHGGRYGFGWLAEHHPEKITTPYALNESGLGPIKAAGGVTYLVAVGEKGRLQVEIEVKGTSAHASMPWQGTNASYGLARALQRIEGYDPERDTSIRIFDYLSNLAIEHKPSPENVDEIIADVEADQPWLASLLRALSRMTLTPTIIRGGVKSNSVPESIRLTCDVRSLPHQDLAYVETQLSEVLAGVPNIDFEIDYMAVPNSSPYETDFVARLKSATELALGREDLQWAPGVCAGFTDSRFTRPLGVETYGFHGQHPDDDPLLNRYHGTDESEGIRSLVTGTKVMLALAYDVLGAK